MAIGRGAIFPVFASIAFDCLVFVIGFSSNKWWSGTKTFFGLWRVCQQDENDSWKCKYWQETDELSGPLILTQTTLTISLLCLVTSCVLSAMWTWHPKHIWWFGFPNVICQLVAVFCAIVGTTCFSLQVLGPSPNEWGFWLCVIASTTSGCVCLINIEMLFVEIKGEVKPVTSEITNQQSQMNAGRRQSTQSIRSSANYSENLTDNGWTNMTLNFPVYKAKEGRPQHNHDLDSVPVMTYPYQPRKEIRSPNSTSVP